MAKRGAALAIPAHAGHARLGVIEFLRGLEHLVGRLGRLEAILLEDVFAVGEDFRLRLDGEAQLHPTLLRAFPRRLLEVARIVIGFLDKRGEIHENVSVLTELRQIDGDQIVGRDLGLRVKEHLLVQDVESLDVELKLAAAELLDLVMHGLHGLEDGVAEADDPQRLPFEYAVGRGRREQRGASKEQPGGKPAAYRIAECDP